MFKKKWQNNKNIVKKGKIAAAVILTVIASVGITLGTLYFHFAPKTQIIGLLPYVEAFTVNIEKRAISSGYQVEVSPSATFDVQVKREEHKETYFSIRELQGGKPYYIRVRTFKEVKGKKIYSFWSEEHVVTPKDKIFLKYISATATNSKVLTKKTISINTVLIPSNTSFNQLTYTSSDSKIATVDSKGTVTGVDAGDVIITVSAEGSDKKAELKIKVEKPFVATTGIKFTDKAGKSVEAGESIQLNAEVIPKDATNSTIIWEVKDDTKATVDSNGVVTALRPTEYLEITAKTKDGKFSAKYILKVTKTKGYITKNDLDRLDLSSVNNLMIVAHPDDESLWGGYHLMNGRYLVVVFTNSYKEKRASELKKAMKMSNDKYLILPYPDIKDTWYKNGKYKYSVDGWTTVSKAVNEDISTLIGYKPWQTIVTHNPNGEYGHLHHIELSKRVTTIVNSNLSDIQEFYYFGNWYSKNTANNEARLDDNNFNKKTAMVDAYLPSSPYAIANNRHMVGYENWIRYQDWDSQKSR